MTGLHSTNIAIKIDVRETTLIYENVLIYHERSAQGLVGLFETTVEHYGDDVSSINILERTLEEPVTDRDPITMSIITKSSAQTGESGGLVEDLGECYLYKMQYLVPDFGKLVARFYFSSNPESKWAMSLSDIKELRHKDNKVFDYVTGDAMKEVAAQIASLADKMFPPVPVVVVPVVQPVQKVNNGDE